MKSITLVLLLFISTNVLALVSGPDSFVVQGEQVVSLGYQVESGQAKPLETSNSWFDSNVETKKLSYSYGLGDFEGWGSEHIVGMSFGLETSDEEKKDGILFYEKDDSTALKLNYSLKPLSERNHSLTAYTSVMLFFDGNKEKFVQGRNDLFQLGLRSNSLLGNRFLFDSWLHYGSGFSGEQNSYVASSFSLGYRFGSPGKIEPAIRLGPYFEYDVNSRRDYRYENTYGVGHVSESIRQIKFAEAYSLDLAVHRKYLLSLAYLKKRTGEDLRSTHALSAQLAVKF